MGMRSPEMEACDRRGVSVSMNYSIAQRRYSNGMNE